MKFKRYASVKVIAIIMAVMLAAGSFFGQQHKINSLKRELYIQQNMTDQKYNYTQTTIDIYTLKEQLNKKCDFKVLDGTVNIKHTYVYQRESILGLKSKFKLVGTADFYYALNVDLSKAIVTKTSNDKIVVTIPKATVDEKTCHRVANTFYRIDDECSSNILFNSNKNDVERATRQWDDTFDIKGTQYIKEYYNLKDIQEKAEQASVHQIKALLEELGYSRSLEVNVR